MIEPAFVFYDSSCATCHFVVKFLLHRRARENFRFLPMQEFSRISGKEEAQINTIRVVENGNLYEQSSAVFMIFSKLGWPWKFFTVFRILPRFFCDFLYRLYARNRYKIAGRAQPDTLCEAAPSGTGKLLRNKVPANFVYFPAKKGQFLNAQWLRLVFLNYEVNPDLLQPHVPEGTELDAFNGKYYCSVVGFYFANTRLGSWQFPKHDSFEEVNLRFYVKRDDKRGVVFIKELVPRKAIAGIARLLFNENYVSAPMDHKISAKQVRYSWETEIGPCSLSAELDGMEKVIEAGSFHEFITEHYFGYVKTRRGETLEYEVEHPRWKVWTEARVRLEGPVQATYGEALGKVLKGRPDSACVADGSAVRVFHGKKIT